MYKEPPAASPVTHVFFKVWWESRQIRYQLLLCKTKKETHWGFPGLKVNGDGNPLVALDMWFFLEMTYRGVSDDGRARLEIGAPGSSGRMASRKGSACTRS